MSHKCNLCEFESGQETELQNHDTCVHAQNVNQCQNKCKENEILERKYELLKEQYERLVAINKNIQEEAKDKDLAKDILVAELRSSYDTTKAENIKLSDSLETQQSV